MEIKKYLLKTAIIFCLPLLLNVKAQVKPDDKYKDLFTDVQLKSIFSDQKRFPDCIPKSHPDSILNKYYSEKQNPDFNLSKFIGENFDTNLVDTSAIIEHIGYLWKHLTREPEPQETYSTLIALPNPYVVPGGRFREIYYWDSYFTMLGLEEALEYQLIENMIDNFAYLIDKYGHVPNGNRTYYLGRSQPPFFSLMVDLLAKIKGDTIYSKYLKYLEKEYSYWMKGEKSLTGSINAINHLVKLENNEILNRYLDSKSSPRPESYKADYQLYLANGKDTGIYREIRSAAESGWDFSSWWFKDAVSMGTISTTQIIPVDLNCLLYHLEKVLSKSYKLVGNSEKSGFCNNRAELRKFLINKYLWDENTGFYFDYNYVDEEVTYLYSLAGLYPLFLNIADKNQAKMSVI